MQISSQTNNNAPSIGPSPGSSSELSRKRTFHRQEKSKSAVGCRLPAVDFSLLRSIRLQRKSIAGLLVEIPYPDQVRHLVLAGDDLAKPPGRPVLVVQVPADDGNVGGFCDVPEPGSDRPNLLAGPLGHDGQQKLVARVE